MPTSSPPSASHLLRSLATGDVSAAHLVNDSLERVAAANPQLNAFLDVDADGARAAAAEIDRKRAAGEPLGRLAGLPVAIKDNICVRGWKTSCGSHMLENFAPPYDAHVIERLKAEDAILLGRTNLDEFAMGSTCESSAFGPTRNPWDTDRSPGGSSGGSAVAVAAGMAPLSVGSDTGGSIRQPGSFCGVIGMKPTYGRVSRYGLVAFASSLDQIGPFARTIEDAALLLESIGGHDPRDSTSLNLPVPDLRENLDQPLSGLKIGIVPEHLGDGIDEDVAQAVTQAIDTYRRLGAKIVEIDLPYTRYGVAAYYLIAPSEASSNLARYDGVHYGHRAESFSNMIDMYETTRGEGFGAEVKRRIMIGTYALSSGYYDAYYLKAMKVRRLIAGDFQTAFQHVDVVLTPTCPSPAFRLGEMAGDPLKMYLTDVYTVPGNLAGLPGISLPCGWSRDDLPIGVQLLAPPLAEGKLFRAARMFENECNWFHRMPPISSDSE